MMVLFLHHCLADHSLFDSVSFAIGIKTSDFEVCAVSAYWAFATTFCLPMSAWLTCMRDAMSTTKLVCVLADAVDGSL